MTLPESLVTLGPSAFAYCRGLTEVTIPANVAHITSVPFYYASNISAIHVAENNAYFASENGVLFDREKTTLLEYPCGKSGAYTVPDEVTAIGNYAFSSSTGLTEITLPEGLATIGADAFQACSGLTTVNMPSAMTSIGSRAFRYCYNLKNIVIPKGVKTIESSTFYMKDRKSVV